MAIDGFLTRSVRDTAVMLDACEGADAGAPYWAPPLARGHAAAISRPPRRLRVGIVDTTFTGGAIPSRGGGGRKIGRQAAGIAGASGGARGCEGGCAGNDAGMDDIVAVARRRGYARP